MEGADYSYACGCYWFSGNVVACQKHAPHAAVAPSVYPTAIHYETPPADDGAFLTPEDEQETDIIRELLAALQEIVRLRTATDKGSLRVRADRMWEIATAAIAKAEKP